MIDFTIDRELMSGLVCKHNLDSITSTVKKHSIWERIAEEYSITSGDTITGRQLSKAWSNYKHRSRNKPKSMAAAATAAPGQGGGGGTHSSTSTAAGEASSNSSSGDVVTTTATLDTSSPPTFVLLNKRPKLELSTEDVEEEEDERKDVVVSRDDSSSQGTNGTSGVVSSNGEETIVTHVTLELPETMDVSTHPATSVTIDTAPTEVVNDSVAGTAPLPVTNPTPFIIDKTVLVDLVNKHGLDQMTDKHKKQELWSIIIQEYTGMTGHSVTHKQLSKAWNNYKQRIVKKEAAKKPPELTELRSVGQEISIQHDGQMIYETKVEVPETTSADLSHVTMTIPNLPTQPLQLHQASNVSATSENHIILTSVTASKSHIPIPSHLLMSHPLPPVSTVQTYSVPPPPPTATIVSGNVANTIIPGSSGVYQFGGRRIAFSNRNRQPYESAFEHKLRIKEHDIYMKAVSNENRYWAAKANTAISEEKKSALELAMVEEAARQKGIFFETSTALM